MLPYLALLRMGFSVPPNVAAGAVGSYRGTAFAVPPPPARSHRFTLAVRGFPRLGRSTLCSTFRRLRLAAYSAQPLAGILPYGARTFLPAPGFPPVTRRLPGRLSTPIINPPRGLPARLPACYSCRQWRNP